MIDRSRLFISRARALGSRSLCRAPQFYTAVTIPEKIGPDLTNVFVNVLPDEERALALLVSFRPFVLQGEPVQLGQFYRQAIASIDCGRSRLILQGSKSRWQRLRDHLPRLSFSGLKIRASRGLDFWMNGYIFHNEPEKPEILEDMLQGLRDALVKGSGVTLCSRDDRGNHSRQTNP